MHDLESLAGMEYGTIAILDYLKYQSIPKKDLDNYPWLKTIIVILFPFSNEKIKKNKYLSARYAYGSDYHFIISKKLEDIARGLKLNNFKCLTDKSFFDEKLLAYLAGLGAYGKNNLIINKRFGTNFAIGEIMTDKVYPNNNLLSPNICENCTKCLKACPTNAITESGFTKTRCLSYLNQYLSDEYPLYDKLKSIIVGCDICQDACPYNQNLEYEFIDDFKFNLKSIITIKELINLDKKSYQEYYKNKAFNWIGYLKMLRNVLTISVNNKDIEMNKLIFFQDKYKDVKWFQLHLEYLKGKLNGNN